MNREDLLAAGWEWKDKALLREPPLTLWRHPEVRDGHLHTFEEAKRAEEIRRTRDGGA